MSDQLQREYYEDIGYKPFLFFLIFGVSGEELEVSRERHKVDELPEGLDIRSLTRTDQGDYIDGFLSGELENILRESDDSLYDKCKAAENCVLMQGSIEDDSTLKYMKMLSESSRLSLIRER